MESEAIRHRHRLLSEWFLKGNGDRDLRSPQKYGADAEGRSTPLQGDRLGSIPTDSTTYGCSSMARIAVSKTVDGSSNLSTRANLLVMYMECGKSAKLIEIGSIPTTSSNFSHLTDNRDIYNKVKYYDKIR
jgi:hypothetical protein